LTTPKCLDSQTKSPQDLEAVAKSHTKKSYYHFCLDEEDSFVSAAFNSNFNNNSLPCCFSPALLQNLASGEVVA